MPDWTKGISAGHGPDNDPDSSSDVEAERQDTPTPLHPDTDTTETPAPQPARQSVDWTAVSLNGTSENSGPEPVQRNNAGSGKPTPDSRKKALRTLGIFGVVMIALVGGVAYVANSVVGGGTDQQPDPEAAAVDEDTAFAPEISTAAPAPETDTDSAAEQTTTDTDAPATPDEDTIGGTCAEVEDSDLPVTRAGQKDLREAWVTYNTELYGHNADGIEAVLTGGSSMRGQDWPDVFDQLDDSSTFCLEMGPIDGDEVTGTVEVTDDDGETTAFSQRATGVEVDGRWFVQDITQAESSRS